MTKRKRKIKEFFGKSLLISICLWFSSAAAFGQEATTPFVPIHAIEIGLNLSYFDYEEQDFDVKWDGFMYGLIGSYTYHNEIMFRTSLEYTRGDINYDGATQGGTPVKEDADDSVLEWRGLLGYDFSFNGHLITPFFGIGYRYWNDDIEGSYAYEREVEYWYSPIGIETVSPLSGPWTWGIAAEYDFFLGGTVKSHWSDVFPGFNSPEVDQNWGDGYGLKFSLRFKRAFANSSALSIEPYISYWDIDESDIGTLTLYGIPAAHLIEPDNETLTYGIRIGWQF